jgi:hypothetical protein
MMSSQRQRSVVRTGRPLGPDGDPLDRHALALDPAGPAADLLRESPRPLVSSPAAGIWATLLETPAEGETDRPVLVQWLAPDADQPPAHVHPSSETFAAVAGELTVVVDGDERRLGPGDAVTVPADSEHTFRNDSDEVVAFRAELPSMQTVRGLYTAWGLDHEGAEDGAFDGPGALHGLVLSADLYPDTEMTAAPLSVQKLLWATAGRVARAVGYGGVDDRYLSASFWQRRVEQPRL